MCVAFTFLLANIYIRFGTKPREIVGIPMATNYAPLVADLFLFCYERDYMMSLSEAKQSEVIEAFSSTSRYLEDLLKIDIKYLYGLISQMYPSKIQLNKPSSTKTEAPYLDLHLSILDGFIISKTYDKRDDFDFQIVIVMGTNCAPLVADLFLFCYERDFMKSLSRENQTDIIEAFNSTSRYLDDLLNINNIYFDQMVDRIYPAELQLNRANSSDTEAPFLDLNLCISNGTVSSKIYDKRGDFDFDIVNFPFLDGHVPRRTSYGVYISQLIRFARASSNLIDFNYRNKALTAKLLRQGYRYFKLRKAFSKFYRIHSALQEKYSVSLKTLLQQGISEPEFYGDLVYRFRKIVGNLTFRRNSENLLTVIKELAIAWILCGRLHA